MKKIKSLIFGAILLVVSSTTNAQVVEQGTILIDAYYGFPNLYTTALKTAYAEGPGVQSGSLKIGGIGPVGGKFEYLIADKVGIGLDFNFTNTFVSYTEFDSFDSTAYNYEVSRTVIRLIPRFNFHFGNSETFDGYAGVGAGYRNSSWKFESNDPDFLNQSIPSFLPVAFRVFVGGRYFFTDNIGLNLEFGLGGGALIQGGLSIKI